MATLSRHPLAALATLALIQAGCGSNPPPPPKPPVTPAQADADPAQAEPTREPAFLEGSGVGATEAEAYEAALDELAALVLGEHRWIFVLEGVTLHQRDRDPFVREELDDGQIQVHAGLERVGLEAMFADLVGLDPAAELPAALAGDLRPAYRLQIERIVCERRLALLDEACMAPSEADIKASVLATASLIELRQPYAGGVPLTAEGLPLRPLIVIAERRGAGGSRTPIADLPITVTPPAGDHSLVDAGGLTGPDGRLELDFLDGAPWPAGVVVAVDRDALLGPLAKMWPQTEFRPQGRRVGWERWGLIATERVQGSRTGDGVFAAALGQSLQRAGAEPRADLATDTARLLGTASEADLSRSLSELADVWAGRVDVLIVAELDSEYASRMSTYRIRYEARGKLSVFDVWTGRRLLSVERSVTASGVGEERADQAARTELAERFADEISKLSVVE
ncbi:hypothetical protein [Haliangium sp.]|uniref:hypothetical protein n=1 Tax=Haliangium sp. TaxID=2663208 RepID=UPI003D10EF75